MLDVTNLAAGYGAIQILWNVSLRVGQGEIVTLLGANGAGKTTMIRALAGEILPSGGTVRFLDRDITRLDAHKTVEAGLIEIPEGRQIWGGLSIEDNLDLGAYSRRARPEHHRSKEWVYSLFPILAERRKTSARDLSGGQQQMLAIGRGLMTDPKVMLLDEPSDGIMPLLVQQIAEKLAEINRREGMTIVIVEQNVPMVTNMAQRCIVLEKGRVVASGLPEAMSQDGTIQKYLAI